MEKKRAQCLVFDLQVRFIGFPTKLDTDFWNDQFIFYQTLLLGMQIESYQETWMLKLYRDNHVPLSPIKYKIEFKKHYELNYTISHCILLYIKYR